jgi:hypothetical protein
MTRCVVLLATLHEFQGPGFQGYVEDSFYEDTVESCIRTGRIDFVFEEAAGRSPSIAEDHANSLLGPGHYLDVDRRDEPSLHSGPRPICGLTAVSVGQCRKREGVWFERMNGEDFKKALLICGVGHSLSFAFRLQDAGFNVELCQHLPYERLCKREHAK